MNSLRTKTDHELIHSFRDGDLQALEALVIRHKDKLYTSILFLVKDKYLLRTFSRMFWLRLSTPFVVGGIQKKVNSFPGRCALLTTCA